MRSFWTLIHRWAGLSIAAFLIIAGLTGSIVAFYHELDSLLNPSLYRAVPTLPGTPMLDPIELRARLLEEVPGIQVNRVPLKQEQGEAIVLYASGTDAGEAATEDDEFFIDPYTGEILGSRKWGDITQGWTNLVPFLFRLHYELALGTFGVWVLGIVATVWTIDCFIGFYLTLPLRRSANPERPPEVSHQLARSWWARWKPAWMIKISGSRFRINFDLHRAGGLWLWAMLFVIAWSSVGFNLHAEIYNPVMKLAFDMRTQSDAIPVLSKPLGHPPIGFAQASEIGHRHMLEQAQVQGFEADKPSYINYQPDKGIYRYGFASDADIRDKGNSYVMFSAKDGTYLASRLPNREATGVQVSTWIMGLHMARIGGLPMQVFICILGLITVLLSITGIIIWWKKRKGRVGRLQMKQRQKNLQKV